MLYCQALDYDTPRRDITEHGAAGSNPCISPVFFGPCYRFGATAVQALDKAPTGTKWAELGGNHVLFYVTTSGSVMLELWFLLLHEDVLLFYRQKIGYLGARGHGVR